MQHKVPLGQMARLLLVLALMVALPGSSLAASPARPVAPASGVYTGTAFRDYNANGLRDVGEPGIQGVLVNMFDGAGVNRGSGTTNSSGAYSFNAAGTGPYRIEFTLSPALSFLYPGAAGGTTVQFVPDGGATADVGFNNPADYSQSNPYLTTPWQVFGDQVDPVNSFPTRNTLTSMSAAWGAVSTGTTIADWQVGGAPI